MMKSMTGFGSSQSDTNKGITKVEIRSINSRGLDIFIKLPNHYKCLELEIRNMVKAGLIRGKIDISILEDISNAQVINKEAFVSYYKELKALSKEIGRESDESLFELALSNPNLFYNENNVSDNISQEDRKHVLDLVSKALEEVDDYRQKEAESLVEDLRLRIANIRELSRRIEEFEKDRIEGVKNRIRQRLEENKEINIDNNRFEQELIYYLERLDITEEKVRLSHHLDYFDTTLESEDSEGRKLIFITQEIGREINTIGSKANEANIQKIAVEMKDDLEKVKEQLLNIL